MSKDDPNLLRTPFRRTSSPDQKQDQYTSFRDLQLRQTGCFGNEDPLFDQPTPIRVESQIGNMKYNGFGSKKLLHFCESNEDG